MSKKVIKKDDENQKSKVVKKSKKVVKKLTPSQSEELVNCAQFAAIVGVKPKSVRQAILEKRISGVKQAGVWKINPIEAAKEWQIHTQLGQQGGNGAQFTSFKLGKDDLPIGEAERRNKVWKSKMSELEYQKKAGELVEISKIKKVAFETSRKVRDALLNIPDRIDHELASLTDPLKVNLKLKKEMIKALEQLVQELKIG